jgi:hypothetical protein
MAAGHRAAYDTVMTRLALFVLALFAGSVHAAASFPCEAAVAPRA